MNKTFQIVQRALNELTIPLQIARMKVASGIQQLITNQMILLETQGKCPYSAENGYRYECYSCLRPPVIKGITCEWFKKRDRLQRQIALWTLIRYLQHQLWGWI
jgi:hypothetical protein